MPRQRLARMLQGGDRRSIGNSHQIAMLIHSEPKRFAELLNCLWNEDALVRMRAADAAEKVSVTRPDLLIPHKQELLGLLAEAEQIELRWHLAIMIPRLELSLVERKRAAALQRYLEDGSSIVKTWAMQGLCDLARQDASLLDPVKRILEQGLRKGTPAMKARGRKLLKELQNGAPPTPR